MLKNKIKTKSVHKYDIPFLLAPVVIEAIPTLFSLRLVITNDFQLLLS